MASQLIVGEAANSELLSKVRTIFHNLNALTEDSLTKEFLDLKVYSYPMAIEDVVSIIIEKASEQTDLCELYTRLCLKQVAQEASDNNNSSRFKKALTLRVQMSTDKTLAEENFELNVALEKKHAIEAETDPARKDELKIELLRVKYEINKRRFAAAQFLGHLYLHDYIPTGVILKWTGELLTSVMDRPKEMSGYEVDEVSIDRAVALFEIVGKHIHESNERIPAENEAAEAAGSHQRRMEFPLDMVCTQLQAALPYVSNRRRERINRLLDASNNGWVQGAAAVGEKVEEKVEEKAELRQAVAEVREAMEAMRAAMATLEDKNNALLQLVKTAQM